MARAWAVPDTVRDMAPDTVARGITVAVEASGADSSADLAEHGSATGCSAIALVVSVIPDRRSRRPIKAAAGVATRAAGRVTPAKPEARAAAIGAVAASAAAVDSVTVAADSAAAATAAE